MVDLNPVNAIRLEYQDSSLNKFWELLRIGGDEWQATYGKNGSSGQSTKYDQKTAQKKVNEKVAKGYKIIDREMKVFKDGKAVAVKAVDFKKLMEDI